MQNALIQLGLELKFQAGVAIESHKLFIFGLGTGEPYTHKFEMKPGTLIRDANLYKDSRCIELYVLLLCCYHVKGAFGMLMLQIPVEGGHRGADLTVRHGLETAQLDRSRDNGHLLYLSASFIDCAHEISPITEGCSVVLTYQLVWNTETRVKVPHGISFPKFFSSLNTVKQILGPFKSPAEDFDTEMLALPLANDYARIPLSYSNLKGSDQLMASLLQSSTSWKWILPLTNCKGILSLILCDTCPVQ